MNNCTCGRDLDELNWRVLPEAIEKRAECSCGEIHYRDLTVYEASEGKGVFRGFMP